MSTPLTSVPSYLTSENKPSRPTPKPRDSNTRRKTGSRCSEGDSRDAESAKKKAATKGKQIKDELKKDGHKLNENRDNPVVVGNALIWGIATVAIGYGAYQKHTEGKLDWQLAGTVAGAVGAFAVADYFGSK